MKKILIVLSLFLLSACVQRHGVLPDPDLITASRYNYELGAGYAKDGLYNLAIEKLEKAIDQDSNNSEAYAALGYVYSKTGRTKEAYDNYNKAISINSKDPIISNNFGVFLCGENKNTEAYKYFDLAANNPKYKEPESALTNAGLCARKTHDLKTGATYLNRALAINPDFTEAQEQLAMLDYEKENYQESLIYVEKLITKSAMVDDVLWAGVKDEIGLGNNEEAKKYAYLLLNTFPQSKWAEQAEFVTNQN